MVKYCLYLSPKRPCTCTYIYKGYTVCICLSKGHVRVQVTYYCLRFCSFINMTTTLCLILLLKTLCAFSLLFDIEFNDAC